jgi:hypothetical protein
MWIIQHKGNIALWIYSKQAERTESTALLELTIPTSLYQQQETDKTTYIIDDLTR